MSTGTVLYDSNEDDLLHSGVGRYGIDMTTTQGLTHSLYYYLFIRHCGLRRLGWLWRIEIIIAFRDYGFVDVEIIPPSQLLRVPSHSPGRSVIVDYPELHLAPRILPPSCGVATTLEYVSTIYACFFHYYTYA